jgi:hypothetical protein
MTASLQQRADWIRSPISRVLCEKWGLRSIGRIDLADYGALTCRVAVTAEPVYPP